ncbi:hypothetical protein ACHAPT_011082 [Fusarium lateritium]
MAAPPLVAQPQPNSSEPDSNVDKPNSNVSEPEWSPWTPAGDRCMRRRPRVPGLNNRWGEWLWYPHWNQYIRFNPVVNGTDVESFEEEFQFRLIDGNPVSVTSPDPHTEQTGHTEPPNIKSEENAVRTKDQGSTIIDESDDLIMFDPEDVGQQGVDIERSGMKTERDEGSSKGSAATPSMHSNITRHQEFIGEQHRASSAITSVKPALTTSPSSVPVASVVSTSGRAVAILSSAADISTAVATWGFGAVMGGLSYANMRAARKTAEASMRSARAAERSAAAAENSAQAGMRSALATEESLTLMQKEFEATNQDNGGRSPSPDNGGSGAGLQNSGGSRFPYSTDRNADSIGQITNSQHLSAPGSVLSDSRATRQSGSPKASIQRENRRGNAGEKGTRITA